MALSIAAASALKSSLTVTAGGKGGAQHDAFFLAGQRVELRRLSLEESSTAPPSLLTECASRLPRRPPSPSPPHPLAARLRVASSTLSVLSVLVPVRTLVLVLAPGRSSTS